MGPVQDDVPRGRRSQTPRARTTCERSSGRCQDRGNSAGRTTIHSVNGNQMRSTSALLMPLRSAKTVAMRQATAMVANGLRRLIEAAIAGNAAHVARPTVNVQAARFPHTQ